MAKQKVDAARLERAALNGVQVRLLLRALTAVVRLVEDTDLKSAGGNSLAGSIPVAAA
jgi:hypothetical protein